MVLSDVCLSVCLSRSSRLTREQRGLGRLKLAEVAHITSDSDTTFKVKRSKIKVARPLWLVVLSGQHGHTVMVTYPYAYMTYIVSPLAGLGGGISWRPPAYSLFIHGLLRNRATRHMNKRITKKLRFSCSKTSSRSLRGIRHNRSSLIEKALRDANTARWLY